VPVGLELFENFVMLCGAKKQLNIEQNIETTQLSCGDYYGICGLLLNTLTAEKFTGERED
jgi:hypothetical protein